MTIPKKMQKRSPQRKRSNPGAAGVASGIDGLEAEVGHLGEHSTWNKLHIRTISKYTYVYPTYIGKYTYTYNQYYITGWLVVWNMTFIFPFSWESSSQLTNIFQRI